MNIPISIDAEPVYMCPLNIQEAQLASTVYARTGIENVVKRRIKRL